MHVTIRQLQVFESVARLLSVTKAAAELHLSQPAVSMQVKQLELAIDLPLFEQVGKKLFLTRAGHEMLHYSREIARQLDEAEQVMEELKGVDGGRLRIAVATTVNYFAARLLAIYHQRRPAVLINLDVTNRANIVRQLENNEQDLVLMGRPPRHLDVDATPFMENPLVIISRVDHPLAGIKKIPLRKLAQETFLMREQGSGTRNAIQRLCDEKQISLTSGIEMTSNEAIKQAVESGLGLGIVSVHTVELELKAKRLAILDVSYFPIKRRWYIVHRRGKRLSATAEDFKQFLLTEVQQ